MFILLPLTIGVIAFCGVLTLIGVVMLIASNHITHKKFQQFEKEYSIEAWEKQVFEEAKRRAGIGTD